MKKIKKLILSAISIFLVFPLPVFASLGYEADYCEGFVKKDSGTESVMTGFHLSEIPVLQYTKVAYELGFSAGDEDESGEVIWIKNRVEENIGQNADNKYMLCVKNYGTLFRKYGEMYGVDPNLLALIAAQEGLCQELGNNQSLAAISGGSSYSRPISGGEPQNPSTPVEGSSGYDIIPRSGYRSPSGQINTFKNNANRNGGSYAVADTISARAGYSDHHTGLVMDVNFAEGPLQNKACADGMIGGNNSCWDEPEIKAVHSLLADYGFIIRYPNGQSAVTGYESEYWHLRYVGKDVAKRLYNPSSNSFGVLENYLSLAPAPDYATKFEERDVDIIGGAGGTQVSNNTGLTIVLNKLRWTDQEATGLVDCGGGQQMKSEACDAFKALRQAVQNYKEEE